MAEYLGLHPIYFDETNSGGSSFEVLVEHAAYAVEAGAAEVVLVTYGSVQLSQMGRRLGTGGGGGGGFAPGPAIYDALWGNTLVGNYALAARRHMHEFGTTPEQLAAVAVTMRHHAATNPQAQEREPITVEDVVSSRLVADPLHKLDCCVISDGGGACVVTTEERAADLPRAPVYVLGAAHATTHHLNLSAMPDLTVTPAAQCGPVAFARAGITPADVDVAQLYDSFTITVVLTVEDLGFCAKGEGGAFVEDGGLEVGGRLPDQHRRRRACRPVIPACGACSSSSRRCANCAARRAPPRSPMPASPWRTGPAACSRPAPPSSSVGRLP